MLVNGGYVTASSTETILTTVNNANLRIESHCKEGFCGACRCKLLRGNVKYPIFPIAYFAEDEVIPCMAIAQSDDVVINQ